MDFAGSQFRGKGEKRRALFVSNSKGRGKKRDPRVPVLLTCSRLKGKKKKKRKETSIAINVRVDSFYTHAKREGDF